MELPSKHISEAVEQFASLPGIGRKTALRLALYLLKQNPDEVERFANSFLKMRTKVQFCKSCHNISDHEICTVCSNPKRNKNIICVVEDMRDVIAIENTRQFNGMYHVLGGIISPVDGIGPADLNIDSLVKKVQDGEIKEVILALSTTMEGDTTNFYLFKKFSGLNVSVSIIARGVAVGDDLEYTDELTLGKSILNRIPYENSFVKH